MINPFRIPGEVPVYPKEETKEEKAARLKRARMRRNMFGIFLVTGFPSIALMAIGFFWEKMTTAEAGTSLGSAAIMSLGMFLATGTGFGWFEDKR